MNLKNLNDTVLIEKTVGLVKQERELLTHVLHHLREIDRRRLFSAHGYKSLFDFAVRYLGYPEDQAYRRISAMKLLKELPELEDKINSGEISLTHIGLAQSLFRQEKRLEKELSSEQKMAVFNQISAMPVRDAEKTVLSLSSQPESLKMDRVKAITDDLIELKFTASMKLREKIDKVKGMMAHANPSLSLGELFEKLCDFALSEFSRTKTAAPRKRCVITSREQNTSVAGVRRAVFRNANHKCENCGSTYALEIDHIHPQAKGGDSSAENLRLLCRNCNQRAAIMEFGQITMDKYINSAEEI